MRLFWSFNISGDHDDWQRETLNMFGADQNVELDENFKRSLLGAKYKEAIEVEEYDDAENFMDQLKQI